MAVLVGTLHYCQKYGLLPCAHNSKTYPNDAKLVTKRKAVRPQRRTSPISRAWWDEIELEYSPSHLPIIIKLNAMLLDGILSIK